MEFGLESFYHILFSFIQVFCGKIPKDMYEDELIPLFEKCGAIWDLRLMMDPMTGLNRGYAFVTFTNRDGAHEAVRQVKLCVNYSVPHCINWYCQFILRKVYIARIM